MLSCLSLLYLNHAISYFVFPPACLIFSLSVGYPWTSR